MVKLDASLFEGEGPTTYAEALKELKVVFEQGGMTASEYAKTIYSIGASMETAIQGVKSFTTVMSSWNTAFAASANLAAGNIDQLVNLYNAQINAIRSQNTYTQALALQSTAIAIYGQNSEQATRATTAANYVGALYTQSKKNEVVAANQYYTATATNLATIGSALVDAALSVNTFIVALVALRASQTAATVATIAETAAQTSLTASEAGASVGAGAETGMMSAEELSQILPALMLIGAPLGFQGGGFVPKTGPYVLHAGETVVPAGATGGGAVGIGSPNVEIHIHASSNVDLARVRQEVESALAKTLLASQKQRGVYG